MHISSEDGMVHGLSPHGLNNLYLDGHKVYWGKAEWKSHTRHHTSAGPYKATGSTRHQALNNLIARINAEKPIVAKSKDRVKFKLLTYVFNRRDESYVLLRDSFGTHGGQYAEMRNEADTFGYVEIVCRPSQFARFLIHREALGFQNMFKELEAQLFIPEPPVVKREPVDVSSNPAQ